MSSSSVPPSNTGVPTSAASSTPPGQHISGTEEQGQSALGANQSAMTLPEDTSPSNFTEWPKSLEDWETMSHSLQDSSGHLKEEVTKQHNLAASHRCLG
jgi:hypothetical protein